MESDCDDDVSYPFDDEDYNSNDDEDYNSNDDEDYNSENSINEEEDEKENIELIDPALQFEKEMKFLYRKYSTKKVVKYHGYKYEEDRQLISNQPSLNIFSFNGGEYFYHRDAFSYIQSCSIKKEYDKRKKKGIIILKDGDNINGNHFVRMSKNDRKKLCKKDKREERQNTGNNKSGSNSKTGKTQQAVRVSEEKAIVQSFTYIDKNSEDKEISPLLNNTSIV